MEDFYIEFAQASSLGAPMKSSYFGNFRKVAASSDSHATLDSFEKLLLVIRKDIGHKNKGIDQNRTLLATFINDLDSIYPKK